MMEIPILQIIVFIALSLCPVKIDTITIRGPGTAVTLVRTEAGWKSKDDGALWTVKDDGITRSLGEKQMVHPMKNFVDAAAIGAFDWEESDSYATEMIRIRKAKNGFEFTFNPKGRNPEPYTISYGTGAQKNVVESAMDSGDAVESAAVADHSVADMPPSVVSTIPQAGDTAVNPELKEIRVTFSKDMMTERMWSICQVSDGSFPEAAADSIHYLGDKRTCVFPVNLQPGKTYVLWFNQGNFNSFRDTGNRPAVPYQLVFQTRAGS